MKTIITAFTLLLVAGNSYGQEFSLIPLFEANSTFVSVSSAHEYSGSINPKPGFGFNAGIIARLTFKEKSNVDVSVFMKQRRNKGEDIIATDIFGDSVGYMVPRLIHNYAGIGLLYHYKFKFNLYLGTGIEFNLLGGSKTKVEKHFEPGFGTFNGIGIGNEFKNHYFRTFNIGIPLVVSYEWKRVLFTLRYEAGILPRVHDAVIKEREHTLSFGVGYVLVKNGKVKQPE